MKSFRSYLRYAAREYSVGGSALLLWIIFTVVLGLALLMPVGIIRGEVIKGNDLSGFSALIAFGLSAAINFIWISCVILKDWINFSRKEAQDKLNRQKSWYGEEVKL